MANAALFDELLDSYMQRKIQGERMAMERETLQAIATTIGINPSVSAAQILLRVQALKNEREELEEMILALREQAEIKMDAGKRPIAFNAARDAMAHLARAAELHEQMQSELNGAFMSIPGDHPMQNTLYILRSLLWLDDLGECAKFLETAKHGNGRAWDLIGLGFSIAEGAVK